MLCCARPCAEDVIIWLRVIQLPFLSDKLKLDSFDERRQIMNEPSVCIAILLELY